MAKLAVAVLMQRVAAAAVELLGPAALLEEGTGDARAAGSPRSTARRWRRRSPAAPPRCSGS